MSKSVEAQLQGPDSQRQGPTNRMSAAMFAGSPTVRAPGHLTEPSAKSPQKQPTKRPEERTSTAVLWQSCCAPLGSGLIVQVMSLQHVDARAART
jgi:hypothetical protein